ncbi:hypothetical protein FPV67DRAFT_1442950 [Lyophyllum atratum]|nr:hypothetical protein FPV67DRAFT_1442950 [Lyophyllum atratum]
MTLATVHVSNIAAGTSERDVSNFFSFCGKINSIKLTPSSGAVDAPLSATITFERESAAKTAVLLDGTPLNNQPLTVSAAHTIDDIAGSHLAPSGDIGPDGEILQENKPRTAVMAEYLAAGYNIGDTVLQKGIDFDKKTSFTTKFASYLTNAFNTIDSKVHVTEKAKAADSQYHITEKAVNATTGLQRYFEHALGTPTGQKVRNFYQTGAEQVLDIHNEAKRLADLKIQKKRQSQDLGATADGKPFVAPDQTTCACGGAAGACGCEVGKCACAGCSKAGAKAEAESKAGAAGQLQHAFDDVKGTAQDVATEKV